MKERLFFELCDLSKKELLEALKNEFKINKNIPIYNDNGETICYTNKYDIYTNYLDFYLTDWIPDWTTKEIGKIQKISIYSEQTIKKDKPLVYPRIKYIIA